MPTWQNEPRRGQVGYPKSLCQRMEDLGLDFSLLSPHPQLWLSPHALSLFFFPGSCWFLKEAYVLARVICNQRLFVTTLKCSKKCGPFLTYNRVSKQIMKIFTLIPIVKVTVQKLKPLKSGLFPIMDGSVTNMFCPLMWSAPDFPHFYPLKG